MTKKKKKTKLAEVIKLHMPDDDIIQALEEMLEYAKEGRLTSLVTSLILDGEDRVIVLGHDHQPTRTIGSLEVIKSQLLDYFSTEEEEM